MKHANSAPHAAGCRPACWAYSRLLLAAHIFPSGGGMPPSSDTRPEPKNYVGTHVFVCITSSPDNTAVRESTLPPYYTERRQYLTAAKPHTKDGKSIHIGNVLVCEPPCVNHNSSPFYRLCCCCVLVISSIIMYPAVLSHLRNPILSSRVVRVPKSGDCILDPSHRLSRQGLAPDHHHPANTKLFEKTSRLGGARLVMKNPQHALLFFAVTFLRRR